MTNDRVLARVERDLEQGHTFLAIQRLTTLVQQDPRDHELRRRLAAVHLQTGNWVEAGRWSYLEEIRDERAVRAFEKAFGDPRARLLALRWPDEFTSGSSAPIRDLSRSRRPRRRGDLLFALFTVANLAVWAVGIVSLVRWLL